MAVGSADLSGSYDSPDGTCYGGEGSGGYVTVDAGAASSRDDEYACGCSWAEAVECDDTTTSADCG